MKIDGVRSGVPSFELHHWWWLSFCDARLPEGLRFLGVVVTEAPSDIDAVIKAHALGVNPGGEVAMLPAFDPDEPGDPTVHSDWADRLLSRDELQRAMDLNGYDWLSMPAPQEATS